MNFCLNFLSELALPSFHTTTFCFQVLVYKGPANSFLGKEHRDSRFHHGPDGFGGAKHSSDPDLTLIRDTPAALAIIELVNKFPSKSAITDLSDYFQNK